MAKFIGTCKSCGIEYECEEEFILKSHAHKDRETYYVKCSDCHGRVNMQVEEGETDDSP